MKKEIKKLLAALLAVVMIVTFTACTSKTNTANTTKVESGDSTTKYPYTFKDSAGREIIIEKEPTKIISGGPAITELVYALGKGSQLVGRTDYCDYPEESKSIQSIGTIMEPNIEKIIELKPDVVLVSAHFKEDVAKRIEDLGIKIVVLYDAKDFNGIYDLINVLGEVVNSQDKANELISSMKKKVEEVSQKVKDKEKPKVYYVVDFGKNGDFTATGDTFLGQIIDMAGGNNIAKHATGWMFSLEKIIENDPEYIVLSKNYVSKNDFMTTDGYKELSAVKNNKVIEIDDNLLNRQGPRIAEGVEALAKILHPELFK